MLHKKRIKPSELRILELLNKRMDLDRKDKLRFSNLKKGYEGECQFDILTEKLRCECLILNDLLLEVNHTTFQIDSLLIMQRNLHIFEIKNHDGDFYYERDKFYKKNKIEVSNPLHQLSRIETLLQQLLLSIGFKLPIDASVVFINPQFTLYQAPMDKPIIFSNQMNQYLEKLSTTPSKLTDAHRKLADQLLALHSTDSPFRKLPKYHYDQLRKGITCRKCHAFSVVVANNTAICQGCGFKEPVKSAVIRAAEEFKTLFPDQKMTVHIIHDWCQVDRSKKAIRNILLTHFTKIGDHRWTYYT